MSLKMKPKIPRASCPCVCMRARACACQVLDELVTGGTVGPSSPQLPSPALLEASSPNGRTSSSGSSALGRLRSSLSLRGPSEETRFSCLRLGPHSSASSLKLSIIGEDGNEG